MVWGFFMTAEIWLVYAIALLVSCGAAACIVLTQRWHGVFSHDHDLNGAQKFHEQPVPRIGGIALMLGMAAAAWLTNSLHEESKEANVPMFFILASLPAFFAGLLEDVTKTVSVRNRLLMTFFSAALAVWLFGASLPRLNILGLDFFMTYAPIAAVVTCFAVAGVANAVNIIDGFNGLASGSVAIMLLGLAGLAWIYQDAMLIILCLSGAAALLGFMVLNFPFGKIFLGDGGAYLAGFWLAECAVLLVVRNPDVSAWAVLLCCVYPIWETIFSIWRKTFYRKTGMGRPDRVHFHMLVYRRLVTQRVGYKSPHWLKHGVTSVSIWGLVAGCQCVAVMLAYLKMETMLFVGSIVAFCFVYNYFYKKAVMGACGKVNCELLEDDPQVQ